MKAKHIFCTVCLFSLYAITGGNASAQLYKWVGPDGKVTYSDVPPPKTAAKVEKKALSIAGTPDSALPYEVGQAARSNPITLYTSTQCGPCDAARQLLLDRGVPFTEKTVTSYDEQSRFRKITGGYDFPYMQIGSNHRKGYESDSWNAALTTAGYPEANMLPKNYQHKPAEPLIAAKPKAEEAPEKKAEEKPIARPKTDETKPPGFQF